MLTVEDCKSWIAENQQDLDRDRLACEDETIQMMNRAMPNKCANLWNTGCWIAGVLKTHGADREKIRDVQFAHGQRSVFSDPFEVAVRFVNEFIETGDNQEKPGAELAQKIMDEVIK